MSGWKCPHGIGEPAQRGDCAHCNADIAGRPAPDSMTGDERAAEVDALLNGTNAYRVGDIHARIDALVGRPTWTHEFATDTRLMEEARGVMPHPADLAQHVLDTARALTDAPIVVVKADE